MWITERLLLRKWEETDAEQLFLYAKDPEIGRNAGFLPPTTWEDSLNIIRNVWNRPEYYAICERMTGKLIGSIALRYHAEREREMGFWIGRPYWENGYMTEAVIEMLRHGFEDLHCVCIWCAYYGGNERSKHVQEKVGFVPYAVYENIPVPFWNEVRSRYINRMAYIQWQQIYRP